MARILKYLILHIFLRIHEKDFPFMSPFLKDPNKGSRNVTFFPRDPQCSFFLGNLHKGSFKSTVFSMGFPNATFFLRIPKDPQHHFFLRICEKIFQMSPFSWDPWKRPLYNTFSHGCSKCYIFLGSKIHLTSPFYRDPFYATFPWGST